MEDLDTIHTKLQSKLKEIETVSDLLPFIEKTVSITNLKAEISTALEQQLAKEKKAENAEEPSTIRTLFGILNSPKLPPKEEEDENEKEINRAMKPRKADDDAKSDDDDEEATDKKKASKTTADKTSKSPALNAKNFARPRSPPRYQQAPPWSNSICYNCNEKGHFARECPRRGPSRRWNTNQRCYHCGKDGHLARNCPDEGNDELNDKCFRCGKMGHWARDCELKKERGGNRFENDKCHRCGKSGHWARDCDQPYQSFSENDKCNRCGKIGHWARDCELPRNDGYGQENDY